MEFLSDDELAKIFSFCSDETRSGAVSLVCKNWNRVERRFPKQLTHLTLTDEAKHYKPTYISWQLRDPHRLTEATIENTAPYCWEVASRLLPRIATLRKLHISPPSYRAFTIHRLPKFLPLVSGFSQLEALSIVRWRLQVEQYHNLRHLLKLRNLRELSLDNVSMIMGEAEIAGFQLRDVIYGLPKLTSLQLINLTISGFPGVLVAANPARPLTNLRSLNLKNSAGMDVAGVVEMTNLSRLRVPVSVDSHSLHLLKTLPRLPHLKALHLEFIAKEDREMEVLLSAMPETGLTALEALRITRTFGSLKALFCRYATAFRPIVERSSWAQALEADVEEWPML